MDAMQQQTVVVTPNVVTKEDAVDSPSSTTSPTAARTRMTDAQVARYLAAEQRQLVTAICQLEYLRQAYKRARTPGAKATVMAQAVGLTNRVNDVLGAEVVTRQAHGAIVVAYC